MTTVYRAPKLQAICASGELKHAVKGEVVGSTGESFGMGYMISGYIKRYMVTDNGKLGLQIIYGPQDIFPLSHVYPSLLNQELYAGQETYYYEAMGSASLYCIEPDLVRDAADKDPELYRELFAEAGIHLKNCVHSIENMAYDSIYRRVAHQLAFLGQEYGERSDKGVRVTIPLTHQDIADILQTTREEVAHTITDLREQGLLAAGEGITIPNLTRLSRASYIE